MLLPNAEQMRHIDRCAINEFKIPGIVLMENAGLGTVLYMERLLGELTGGLFPIFIGPGNNGGDGLVIARHLHQRKALPLLVFVVDPDRLTGDSATNLAIVEKLGLHSIICTDSLSLKEVNRTLERLAPITGGPVALIDSIFGTGLDRPIEGHFHAAVELLNSLSVSRNIPILAVDTPSGLCSDSGRILGCCVKARATATYGFAKIGQVQSDSGPLVGSLEVIDIGLPPEVLQRVQVRVAAIDHNDHPELRSLLQRPSNSHKGSFGHLLILGGSPGKTGAALLAARGALRSGCGLVSICAPSELNTIYETALPEAMSAVLESPSHISIKDKEAIVAELSDKTCAVVGPGIGQLTETAELVIELYRHLPIPMVLDADALNILARHKSDPPIPRGPRIFTPHPGEMARLLGSSTEKVQRDRRSALAACFKQFKTPDSELIIVLKGNMSLTTDGSSVWLNRTGNPAMATGGMGDVLGGLIGSLLCQGLGMLDAARFGVYLHGLCGDLLHERTGVGFSASELADQLSPILAEIMRGEDENCP